MAVVRCPNCGKENPESLSVCQFCQTPLASGNAMQIGDKPTKKNTGELEPVLPDWLRDIRQQARDSAEQDAAEAATMPKIQKEEPPDLLAGLASQSSKADDDELPDWLSGLTPKKEQPPAPVAPARPTADFFAQFDQPGAGPKSESEPPQPPSLMSAATKSSPVSPERDELSEWFTQAAEEPAEPFSLEADTSGQNLDWGFQEDASPIPPREPASPAQEEDLSWLRNLEAESKKTGELSQPKPEDNRSSVSRESGASDSSNQEDLSWLDNLGALPASEQPKQGSSDSGDDLSWLSAFEEPSKAPPQPAGTPASTADDLSWLDALGSTPTEEAPASVPKKPEEDLSWLSAFGGIAAASQKESASPAAQDDLSWLDELDGSSQPPQPLPFAQEKPISADDMSWLSSLQETSATSSSDQNNPVGSGEAAGMPHVPPFSPRRTAPLDDTIGPELPDWLKSAAEEPSMPLGPQALDRMREERKLPTAPDENVSRALFGTVMRPRDEQPGPPMPEPPSVEPAPPAPASEAAPLFNEASSLFSEDLPDWLSSAQPAASQTAEEIGINAEGGEALSPADLPSWVQAMRPVEAMVAATAIGMDDQPAEQEGPLAGLKGVIPAVALGSLRRPQPIPLTLQATEEQQASAAILEQILLGETTPRPVAATPVMASQQRLRWLIAGLLLIVLGAVIFSGTQVMPVSPVLSAESRDITGVVMNIADNAPVLVIMDYQPALAGEMEAVSGPLLDQLVRLHHPFLSFVATSPSGIVLVERLLVNANINQPGGAGYVSGQNYTNMGYLPGGEAGVLAFLQSPQAAIPASPVLNFSEYAAVLLLTDHAESARSWVEQLSVLKQTDPATFASQPLLALTSAQTGPMLQPYFYSGQITGMISGLPNAVRYESLNDNRPGMARTYWDAFGIGMMMAVLLIVLGSLWSMYTGIRTRSLKAVEE
jgi:hypothetical protein